MALPPGVDLKQCLVAGYAFRPIRYMHVDEIKKLQNILEAPVHSSETIGFQEMSVRLSRDLSR